MCYKDYLNVSVGFSSTLCKMMSAVYFLLLAVFVSHHDVMGDRLGQLCIDTEAVGTSETLRQICQEYYQNSDGAYSHISVYYHSFPHTSGLPVDVSARPISSHRHLISQVMNSGDVPSFYPMFSCCCFVSTCSYSSSFAPIQTSCRRRNVCAPTYTQYILCEQIESSTLSDMSFWYHMEYSVAHYHCAADCSRCVGALLNFYPPKQAMIGGNNGVCAL